MKNFPLMVLLLLAGFAGRAQGSDRPAIRKGNQQYRKSDFEAARQNYVQALSAHPEDPLANYNMGNALFRGAKPEDAVQAYDNTIQHSDQKPLKEKAFYNKGVAMIKQQKLPESIEAWKQALKLDPNDQQARENLQKALAEQKKQQQQDQKKQEDKKQPQQEQKKQPQPQSKLNKQQVEQRLKALEQQEKEVQQKMQKGAATSNKPEKDW